MPRGATRARPSTEQYRLNVSGMRPDLVPICLSSTRGSAHRSFLQDARVLLAPATVFCSACLARDSGNRRSGCCNVGRAACHDVQVRGELFPPRVSQAKELDGSCMSVHALYRRACLSWKDGLHGDVSAKGGPSRRGSWPSLAHVSSFSPTERLCSTF